MFVDVFGWCAAIFGASIFLPQVVRLLRSRTSKGLSLLAWQLVFGGNLAWISHGLITGHVNIWVPNLILLGCTSVILWLIRRDRRINWLVLVGPGVVLGVVTIMLDLTAGPIAFAVAAFLPSAIGQLAQLRDLVLSVNVRGLSMTFLVMSLINHCSWFSWSMLASELSVALVASSLGALTLVNCVWALLRHLRLVRPLLAHF